MKHFCTIITANYLPYAQQLYTCLSENFSGGVSLHTLISDVDSSSVEALSENLKSNIICYSEKDLKGEMADAFRQKYAEDNMDAYRWSMKTVFMKQLFGEPNIEKLIYLDCDIFFVGNGDFLFDMLSKHRFLITPHWRCASDPAVDMENFQLNFLDGVYNAGFIGARKDAIEILDFWGNCCLAVCEKNRPAGFYVDQKYLDILPSRFPGIEVVRHKGCNLAGWNTLECPRSENEKGGIKIDGEFDPVFIHFTPETRRKIKSGDDPLFEPYFNEYNNLLKDYSNGLIDLSIDQPENPQPEEPEPEPLLEAVRRTVRLRTRIKAFMDGKIVRK